MAKQVPFCHARTHIDEQITIKQFTSGNSLLRPLQPMQADCRSLDVGFLAQQA